MAKPTIETTEFHGLEAFRLTAANGATAIVSRLGGQVLSWKTGDGKEHLYLSERARFDASVSIRGGIPVCFPQFAGLGKLPKHGLLRTRLWTAGERNCRDDYAVMSLSIEDDAESRALWPHAFRVEVTVALEGNRIDVELEIENTGATPFSFTGALHTYLRVTEVERIALQGLRGLEYRDAANGDAIKREGLPELSVDAEVDRIYHNVSGALLLSDSGKHLGVHAEGFPDAVVWNPWEILCAKMSDMEPRDFRHMLCIDAAVARPPHILPPGGSWSGRPSLVAI